MLAADLHHRLPRLRLSQYPKYLLFAVPSLPHPDLLLVSSDNHEGHELSTSDRLSFWVLGQQQYTQIGHVEEAKALR
jgi:hypothetical protein